MKRRGFTLIELMAVVAIIGILLGIVMTAAANSIKLSRRNKAATVCKVILQGIETYREQKDEWPGGFESTSGGKTNQDGVNGRNNPDRLHLDSSQIRSMIREVVEETCLRRNPMMDVSGLFVSRSAGEAGERDYGLDFQAAVHGTEESPEKMSISEMYFGYPEESNGYFRRVKIVYSRPTDSMEVTQQ